MDWLGCLAELLGMVWAYVGLGRRAWVWVCLLVWVSALAWAILCVCGYVCVGRHMGRWVWVCVCGYGHASAYEGMGIGMIISKGIN